MLAQTLAAIPPPPRSGFELGPLNVRFYGVVIAVGALLAITLFTRRYERSGGDPQVAEHAGLLALLGGFLGARIGYVIPRFLNEGPHGAPFIERPLDILAIWQGGLAFFGGLVGGALAVIVYLRWRRASLPVLADALIPGLPLAQAFGRWGNYFNQELFGTPTDLPWALRVEPVPSRIAERFPGATTFHPTFLYESLWNFALAGLLLLIDRKRWLKRRGSLVFIYLIGYGVGRGWIEALRTDTEWTMFGLSRNNWIAILVVIIGIAGLIWWERNGTAELLAESDGRDGTSTADTRPEADEAATTDETAADRADDPGSDEEIDGVDHTVDGSVDAPVDAEVGEGSEPERRDQD